jgi:L-threonylcarbamoyladenylate synthase
LDSYYNDLDACVTTLQKGGVILYPTDTVWGLGCDATNPAAVNKVFDIKQRALTKSLIVLLANEAKLSNFIEQPTIRIFDYIKGINKPTTVIYNGAKNLAPNVYTHDKTVAIRITSDDFCKKLIEQFGKPIISTSANISGQPTPNIYNQISNQVIQAADYVVKYRQDDTEEASPSSIIKWLHDGSIEIIRP